MTTKGTTTKNTRPVDAMIDVPYEEGHYRFWERRMHLDDIFMELALPWDTDVDVVEVAKAIVAYCKTTRTMPLNTSWKLVDNVLYANDTALKRVGATHKWDFYNEEADYWEGRCLDKCPLPE